MKRWLFYIDNRCSSSFLKEIAKLLIFLSIWIYNVFNDFFAWFCYLGQLTLLKFDAMKKKNRHEMPNGIDLEIYFFYWHISTYIERDWIWNLLRLPRALCLVPVVVIDLSSNWEQSDMISHF